MIFGYLVHMFDFYAAFRLFYNMISMIYDYLASDILEEKGKQCEYYFGYYIWHL